MRSTTQSHVDKNAIAYRGTPCAKQNGGLDIAEPAVNTPRNVM